MYLQVQDMEVGVAGIVTLVLGMLGGVVTWTLGIAVFAPFAAGSLFAGIGVALVTEAY